jgi:transketolase
MNRYGRPFMANFVATREAYGNALTRLAEKYPNFVTLDADLSAATKTSIFTKKYPQRGYNMGIAEQNMIGFAAGLALVGIVPFASTFSVFASGRTYDQIRQSVAYPKTNVKIVGTHGGLTVGEDGATHQALEDIALMRVLPNMTVIVPADAIETEKAVEAILEYEGPVYLRLGREALPEIMPKNYRFQIGKSYELKQGKDLYFVATGIMVAKALDAANELAKKKIDAGVLNISTIKPLDEEALRRIAGVGKVIVAEEHSVFGGLGSAISEFYFKEGLNRRLDMRQVGVQDSFGQTGKPDILLEKYGLTTARLISETLSFA